MNGISRRKVSRLDYRSVLAAHNLADGEVDRLEKELAEAKRRRTAARAALLQLPPGCVGTEEGYDLYWNGALPPAVVAHLLGVKKSNPHIVAAVGAPVGTCDAGHVFGVPSRYWWAHGCPCPECARLKAVELERLWEEEDRRWTSDRPPELTTNGDGDVGPVDRVAQLRAMPYAEYLLSPEWQATRKAALKRADYRCQLCGARQQLHVHHNTYERRGAERPSDLIALCADCHRAHHGIDQ